MIKGILFDKDGTLITFNRLWLKMVDEVIEEVLGKIGQSGNKMLKNMFLESVGVNEGKVSGKEILASGTSYDTAKAFQPFLSMELDQLHKLIKDKQLEFTRNNLDLIESIGDPKKLMTFLRKKDIVIGVVTADDAATTKLCLKKIGIEKDVDYMATADLYDPKPSPESFQVFCENFNLKPEEVAMVGDTTVDLKFAKNSHAGYAVGVLSGTGTKIELDPLADYIVTNIDNLLNIDEIWS